jgi:predicted MFS family arabinose efflux permease
MPPWVSGFVFSVYALVVFIASPFMGKAVSTLNFENDDTADAELQ